MINLITGKPGSGKTLYLAKIVQQLLKDGAEVWSYIRCRFNDDRVHYFRQFSDITGLKNIAVILDEAQIWFDAREWDKLSFEMKYSISQERHNGWELYASTQHYSDIDVIFRRKIHNYYEVRKILGTNIRFGKVPKNPWGLFALSQFHPNEADKVKRINLGFKLFIAKKKLFDFYDTLADLGFTKDESNISYVKCETCPTCGHKKIDYRSSYSQIPRKKKIPIPDTAEIPF